MTEATELAALVGTSLVDRALGLAATSGRFATGDLASIVDYLGHSSAGSTDIAIPDDDASLLQTTRTWEGFGR